MISNDTFVCDFAPDSPSRSHEESPRSSDMGHSAEPTTSFFRGVMVGLAVTIPVWTWIILPAIR